MRVPSPLMIVLAAWLGIGSLSLAGGGATADRRGVVTVSDPSPPAISANPHVASPDAEEARTLKFRVDNPHTFNPHAYYPFPGTDPATTRPAAERPVTERPVTERPGRQLGTGIPPTAGASTLGAPRALDPSAIPAEARALLPPGCLDTWQMPAPSLEARMVSERPTSGGPPGEDLLGDDLLGDDPVGAEPLGDLLGDSLGNPLGADPLSLIGPAAEAPLGEAPLAEDPLNQLGPPPAPAPYSVAAEPAAGPPPAEDPHRALFLEDMYPSALTCAKCHPTHYDQWRVSAHAYAVASPMFQRFEQKMTELTKGTVGHFCMRCHAPVATQLQIPRHASILDAPPVIREGITCIACHRVRESYGETNGGRRVEPGDIFQPVYGGGSGEGVRAAIADAERLKLKTDPSDTGPGQAIHSQGIFFEPLTRSDFCLSCHQVSVHPGIALEVVYSQYRAGPAAAKGITCQQCHMGQVPGKPHGFACGPIAEVGGKPYGEPQPQSNHMFWGPGYSIAHPGIFPQNEKAERWSPRQWLEFDWQQGWGTEEFERAYRLVESASPLPPPWDNADERRDARRVLDDNLRALAVERRGSIATMEAGSEIRGPMLDPRPRVGEPLRFQYIVRNVSEGHNLPTGSLGAQPQVWLNVALVAPDGRTIWESGYLDSHGDLADMNSLDVAQGRIARDAQLFNLQTKFLITNLKGTEREVSLPVNVDLDPLPFLRPGAVPTSVLNHPPLVRMEAHSIAPLDSRTVHYRVPADRIRVPGLYRLDVRLRSRVEPSYFMRFVGMSAEEINRMNLQILNIHTRSHSFYVE